MTAGTAAAVGNNATQVAGVAYAAKIMPLRISDTAGTASLSTAANAITYAADHGARVVNSSYMFCGQSTIRSAGQYMNSKGGLVTISEGNYATDYGYPSAPELICVSATDGNDVL